MEERTLKASELTGVELRLWEQAVKEAREFGMETDDPYGFIEIHHFDGGITSSGVFVGAGAP